MVDDTPETQPVMLTLEESGWLIHLLIAEMLKVEQASKDKQISTIMTPEVYRRIHGRMTMLHAKLADANDKLMGKTP